MLEGAGLGYVCCGVAALFFGSNFAPVKRYDTGDGFFFQWVMCFGVWIVGLCVNLARDDPKFQPWAMLGGALWATGNVMTVPIIKMIGMSMGLLVWGACNMLTGWATGTFGWFGLDKDAISTPALNYAGVGLVLVALYLYIQIETVVVNPDDGGGGGGGSGGGEAADAYRALNDASADVEVQRGAATSRAKPAGDGEGGGGGGGSRALGLLLSVCAGVLYGANFDPPTYLQTRSCAHNDDCTADSRGPHPGWSANPLDYVFAHFCGILVASTAYFLAYCAREQRRGREPQLFPKVVLPAVLSGRG